MTGPVRSDGQGGSLGAATAKGFAWTLTQALGVRVLSLVGFVVLARYLTPAEYGLAALANVFGGLLYTVGAAGLGPALVQRASLEKADLDTVFWFGTAIGAALGAALSLAAWPLADVFDQPELRPVLQWLSLGFVFIGLGSTQLAVLQRRLAFVAIARSGLVANLVATAAGVAFAVGGLGVYALVVQVLLAPSVQAVLNVAQSGYRPGRGASWQRFKEIFSYSRNILGSTLMAYANTRTDDFLIGGFIGSRALGIYSVGYRLLTIMVDVVATTTRSVAFPVFSRLQDDRARLRNAYAAAVRLAAALALPVFAFVLCTAPLIIPVTFGRRWEPSVPIMQILCAFGPLYAVVQFNTALLQSVGRARLVFRLSLMGTILQLVLFAVAVNFGIRWVAAAFVIRAYLLSPWYFRAAREELSIRAVDQFRGLLGPLVATGAMCAAVLGGRAWMAPHLPGTAAILVLSLVALATYLAAMWIVGRDVLAEAFRYLRQAFRRGDRLVPATPAGDGDV